MIVSIGVLFILAGVSILIIGLVKYFFPSAESLIPKSFKRVMTIRGGVYSVLFGLVLVRFFS